MSHDAGTRTAESSPTIPRRVSWGRYGYVLVAGLFTVCVLVQFYVAGMAVFVDSSNWVRHTTFVHSFEPLVFVLLALAFVGRLPRLLQLAPLVLFCLLTVQYATANVAGSAVAAFHPVNGVLVALVALGATKRAWSSVRSMPQTL